MCDGKKYITVAGMGYVDPENEVLPARKHHVSELDKLSEKQLVLTATSDSGSAHKDAEFIIFTVMTDVKDKVYTRGIFYRD